MQHDKLQLIKGSQEKKAIKSPKTATFYDKYWGKRFHLISPEKKFADFRGCNDKSLFFEKLLITLKFKNKLIHKLNFIKVKQI